MLSAPAVNGWKIFTGIEMEVTTRMCWGQNFLFKTSFLLFWKKKNIARKKELAALSGEKGRERKKIYFFHFIFYKLKKRKNGGNKKMRKTIFGFFSFEAKKKYSDFSTRLTLNRIEADPKRLFSVLMNKYYPKEWQFKWKGCGLAQRQRLRFSPSSPGFDSLRSEKKSEILLEEIN